MGVVQRYGPALREVEADALFPSGGRQLSCLASQATPQSGSAGVRAEAGVGLGPFSAMCCRCLCLADTVRPFCATCGCWRSSRGSSVRCGRPLSVCWSCFRGPSCSERQPGAGGVLAGRHEARSRVRASKDGLAACLPATRCSRRVPRSDPVSAGTSCSARVADSYDVLQPLETARQCRSSLGEPARPAISVRCTVSRSVNSGATAAAVAG